MLQWHYAVSVPTVCPMYDLCMTDSEEDRVREGERGADQKEQYRMQHKYFVIQSFISIEIKVKHCLCGSDKMKVMAFHKSVLSSGPNRLAH